MTLQLIAAPVEYPVTLAEAKLHLRIDGDYEDSLINGLIGAAVSHFDAQGVLGRAMVTQTWAQWVSMPSSWVRLLMGPFAALTSVHYYDADNVLQEATLSDFEIRLDGDFVRVGPVSGKTWPSAYSRNDAIKITYTAGFGAAADVPMSIKQAMLLTVGHWYQNREAVVEGTFKELPMAVEALLGIERVGWYG